MHCVFPLYAEVAHVRAVCLAINGFLLIIHTRAVHPVLAATFAGQFPKWENQ